MRKAAPLIFALVLVLLLSGCFGAPLDEAFDEASVETVSVEVVELLAAGEYQAVNDMVLDDLKDDLSADTLASAVGDYLADKGEYDSIEKTESVGKTNEEGLPYAVTLVTAKFTSGTAKISVSLNTDYKIVGLYVY